MRVLLATETYHPTLSGAVVFIDTLASFLVEQGHTVAIFAPSSGSRYRTVRHGQITVYQFPSLPNPFREGSRFVLYQQGRVRAAFQEFDPDVVHLQSPSGVPAAVKRVALRTRVPVVATHHFSFEFIAAYLKPFSFMRSLTHRAVAVYLNQFYARCACVTCPTASIKAVLQEAGVRVPLTVVSNGVDTRWFLNNAAKDSEASSQKDPMVLAVTRIDPDKNIPTLLATLPLVLARVPAHFVIVGSGTKLTSARLFVAQHGLQGSVTFMGKLPHRSAVLRQLYRSAAACIVTSNIETQSLVTLEALAAGVPVVAARAGALPELVENGHNGFLVTPNDPQAFADRLIYLLTHPNERDEMAELARQSVQGHDIATVLPQFLAIYRKVTESSSQA